MPKNPVQDAEAVLMFSGGMDSSLTAAHLAERFRKVHLITYRSRRLARVESSRINARKLAAIYGSDRVVHTIIDLHDEQRELLEQVPADYVEYCSTSAPGVLCLGCKLTMYTRTLVYCLEHGVTHAADGALRVQADHPECMPGTLNAIKVLFAEYGVAFDSPFYEVGSKREVRQLLADKGIELGPMFGATSRKEQPFCLLGPFTTIWHFDAPYDEDQMERYVHDKLPLLRRRIRRELEQRGLSEHEALATPLPVPPEALYERRPIVMQVEFGPRRDRWLSRSLGPVWWTLDRAMRWSSQRG